MSEDNRYETLRAELSKLRDQSAEPPAQFEDAVVERVRSAGMIASHRPARLWYALAAVAAMATFLIGVALGRMTTTAKPPEFTYVLLLEEDADYQTPATQIEMDRRVNEYRNWAGGLRNSGVAISGIKLQDDALTLGAKPAPVTGEILAGMFSIKAADIEHAKKIAETCPHLQHGGRVVIRPIEKT